MHSSRYALIRYLDADGKTGRVGSGLIVRDRAVLTANHVANGSRHVVECVDSKHAIPVASAVRSDHPAVDLAVLLLAEPVPGLEPMPYARIDRRRPVRLGHCVAVGFPLWNMDGKRRVTVQLEGFVRTAEGLRMLADGGMDGQFLILVGDRVPGDPDLPEGTIDYELGSPWAGMSGAVVVTGGMVVGVISSHQLRKGFQSLTVTPLTALNLLSPPTRGKFSAALGIGGIDQLALLRGEPEPAAVIELAGAAGTTQAVVQPQVSAGTLELSGRVRERYAHELVTPGLPTPERWDLAALEPLRRECQHKALAQDATDVIKRAADTLEALCDAAAALPALTEARQVISTRKLQHLYLRHVRTWPDAGSLDEMLVLAASVAIVDRRRPVTDHGGQPGPLNALAKFLLGIAAHWKGPGPVTLADPDLGGLADLITRQLEVPPHDAAQYLAGIRRRCWALIEFVGQDLTARDWPTQVRVDLVPDQGAPESQVFACATPSLAGVEDALRNAVNWLPEGDVYIDLCLPRQWLDAGVEHWNVVDVGGVHESLSPDYQPRLRWAMHRNNAVLRERLRKRFESVDWLADPEDIPADLTADEAGFGGWLTGRDRPGTKYPPYFTGGSPPTGGHDPLAALLRKGYGCITWFGKEAVDGGRHDAVRAAIGLSWQGRRDNLPEVLAATLAAHRPAIIWSDPDGRADFPMPPPRPAGSLRKGGQ